MRGLVQSEIFGVPPFGRHFGHGPCHSKRPGPNFMDLEKIGWLFRGHHGFEHGPSRHHGHRGHHGHHGPHGHHGHHGHHDHHDHHDHHGHREHHGHKGHHYPRKLRSPSPDCHCGPHFGSPGPQDHSPSRGPNRPEHSGPGRRECEGFRRKDKRSRGCMRRGPCGRSPYDCCPPRFSRKPGCCKGNCQKKQTDCSGNESDQVNENESNCTENRNNEAVTYERVVVENNPGGSSA